MALGPTPVPFVTVLGARPVGPRLPLLHLWVHPNLTTRHPKIRALVWLLPLPVAPPVAGSFPLGQLTVPFSRGGGGGPLSSPQLTGLTLSGLLLPYATVWLVTAVSPSRRGLCRLASAVRAQGSAAQGSADINAGDEGAQVSAPQKLMVDAWGRGG